MLKVFLIGFLCVALTHQASIGDSLKEGLEKTQDQAKSLTGQQRSVRSIIGDVESTLQEIVDAIERDDTGLRKKRQFEMFGDMMSKSNFILRVYFELVNFEIIFQNHRTRTAIS